MKEARRGLRTLDERLPLVQAFPVVAGEDTTLAAAPHALQLLLCVAHRRQAAQHRAPPPLSERMLACV